MERGAGGALWGCSAVEDILGVWRGFPGGEKQGKVQEL